MQVRDVRTRQVVSVGPDTSAEPAAELMAHRGVAARVLADMTDSPAAEPALDAPA